MRLRILVFAALACGAAPRTAAAQRLPAAPLPHSWRAGAPEGPDTLRKPSFPVADVLRTTAGGVAGGAVGLALGGLVGGAASLGHDGIGSLTVGALLGESALLPAGVHLANRGRGAFEGAWVLSLALGAAGVLALDHGVIGPGGYYGVVVPLQLASSTAIELKTSRARQRVSP